MIERILIYLKKILLLLKKIIVFVLIFFKKLIFVEKEDSKNDWWGTFKNIAIALFVAIIIRSFLYEPFHIPSGSMKPNLKEGDFIFVSKYDFGYTRYSFPFGIKIFNDRIFFKRQPKRGEVLVFRLPSQPSINYIKRLAGLPGDKIQMINGILHINNSPIEKKYLKETLEYEKDEKSIAKEYKETIDGIEFSVLDKFNNTIGDNTKIFVVPEKHYFFLGDNRDNSLDSRFIETGFVPEDKLIGKARIIFFSINDSFLKFWKWPKSIRTERLFKKIK